MKKYAFLLFVILISGFSFSQTEEQKKLDFTKKVRDADMLFAQGNYLEAKKTYEAAASINPNDTGVKKQIDLCVANEKKKSSIDEDKEYRKIVNKADEKFKSGDYQGAKDLFLRAVKNKSTDPYPPKMLKQIEDLLNPTPVAKSEPLPDLGQTSEMSIVEAEKALKAAELERKNRQNVKLGQKNEGLSKNEDELSKNRLKEMEAAGINFADVRKHIDSLEVDNKLVKDSLNLKLQSEEHTVISIGDMQQSFQYFKRNAIDNKITTRINTADSLGQGAKQIGKDNDGVFFSKSQNQEDTSAAVVKQMQASRANVETTFNTITYKEEKKNNDNRVSKEEVTELVNETNQSIIDLESELSKKNIKNSNEMVENNLDFSEKGDARDKELYKIAGDNQKFLIKKREQRLQVGDSLATVPSTIRNKTHDSITLMYRKTDYILTNTNDSNRYESNNSVKAITNVVLTEIDDISASQLEQRNKSEGDIVKQKNVHNIIDETSKEKQDLTSKKIVEIEEKQTDGLIAAQAKETSESYNSQDKINSLEAKVLIGLSAEKANTSENKTSLNTLENTIEGGTTIETEQRRVQTLEARTMLENIEKKEVKFDDKAANSIGSLYPEGVTQEQFNKNDENGILLSVVTRRIVVKAGYGQVYTRTQTSDTITYSKNGTPSTEFVWQKETQDAKLKKN